MIRNLSLRKRQGEYDVMNADGRRYVRRRGKGENQWWALPLEGLQPVHGADQIAFVINQIAGEVAP